MHISILLCLGGLLLQLTWEMRALLHLTQLLEWPVYFLSFRFFPWSNKFRWLLLHLERSWLSLNFIKLQLLVHCISTLLSLTKHFVHGLLSLPLFGLSLGRLIATAGYLLVLLYYILSHSLHMLVSCRSFFRFGLWSSFILLWFFPLLSYNLFWFFKLILAFL